MSRSPVVRNTVCTWLTYPGTTIVFTFVPDTRMPWITSGLARRKVTSRPSGTTTQFGTKANCVATMRAVTCPLGSTRVPRFGSVNSPLRCSVFGSIRSAFEGGLRCSANAATSVSANRIATNPITAAAQRSSERTTSCSVQAIGLSDHPARQVDQQIDQQPGDQQQQHGRTAEGGRAGRHTPQRFKLPRVERGLVRRHRGAILHRKVPLPVPLHNSAAIISHARPFGAMAPEGRI